MSVGVRWAFDFMSWKPSLSDIVMATSAIQAEERTRIGQFVYQKDARSSLIGRLLMRKYSSEMTGVPWENVDIQRDQNNKPFLNKFDNVKFNVSHQGKYVVMVGEVGDVKLGVDVMEQEYTGGKPLSEFFRLMHRNFSQSEWATILSSNENVKQTELFFRFWTLKESYVKATGTGITVPLDKISFRIETPILSKTSFSTDTLLYLDSVVQGGWTFQEMALDSNYCVSVALYGAKNIPELKTDFNHLSFSDIVANAKPLSKPDTAWAEQFLSKPITPK